MLTASRSFIRAGRSDAGAPLPRVAELNALYEYGFTPRMGQMLMIAGMPGAQKSGFCLWLASKWNLPTLYFAADMDEVDATTRLAAQRSGHTVAEVEQGVEMGEVDYYARILGEAPIQFCYDGVPSLDDVHEEMDAYVELWDAYPQVIVFDNLLNVESEGDKTGLNYILTELKDLAKVTNACVIVLHHMSEANQRDPYQPCARRDLQNKVSELPQRILSVAMNSGTGEFKLAAVKNRQGNQDPTGKHTFSLKCEPERASFSAWVPGLSGYGYGGYAGE